uniref:DNA repair protein RecO n=1 Tax=Roseihalotalea indica TaxID=2867963 RepID=A0AA49JJX1_9BACT|nr:DNA repair protein RecO [Tunicatimonas sp. TK19036]
MLHKTKGIVLNFIKYRETSIVTRIYTEDFGLQSYIVNGVRGSNKKSKSKISFFQPLTVLELVVYYKKNAGLNRISEIKCPEPYQTIPYDFRKSSIAMFITEVLNKCLKEEESNIPQFEFLHYSLQMFDHLESHYENFHLQLMLKLSRYLGFAPESADDVFDEVYEYVGKPTIHDEDRQVLNLLLQNPYTSPVKTNNATRRLLLDDLIKYYQMHVGGFGELKSLTILREVLE